MHDLDGLLIDDLSVHGLDRDYLSVHNLDDLEDLSVRPVKRRPTLIPSSISPVKRTYAWRQEGSSTRVGGVKLRQLRFRNQRIVEMWCRLSVATPYRHSVTGGCMQ